MHVSLTHAAVVGVDSLVHHHSGMRDEIINKLFQPYFNRIRIVYSGES